MTMPHLTLYECGTQHNNGAGKCPFDQIRTGTSAVNSRVLYQLSYEGKQGHHGPQ